MSDAQEFPPERRSRKKRGRAFRILKRVALGLVIAFIAVATTLAIAVKDHVRSLWSFQRIPNTNMYCMDYYSSYNIEEIREKGIDVTDIEGSLIRVFFPDLLVPLVTEIEESDGPHVAVRSGRTLAYRCSTASFRTEGGQVYFGRNFDWAHDPCLILRIHGRDVNSSVAILDLHYLDLDQAKLESPALMDRVRLLFAPYVVMDGMNEYGVAVSEMASGAEVPYDSEKPNITNSLAMRLILDYARNTDEAVELLREYNIHFPVITCHFMVADASGTSVIVEFIDGEMRTLSSEHCWQVCTNKPVFGRSESEKDGACDRYRKASDRLMQLGGEIDLDGLGQVMASVSVEDWTMWTSLYDLTSGEFRVAYRGHFDEPYADRLTRNRCME